MRFIEFFGIELIALGMFAWWFLAYLRSKRRRLSTELAHFVGGPLDGRQIKLVSIEPSYTYKVPGVKDKYAIYLHDSYGVYLFDNYVMHSG